MMWRGKDAVYNILGHVVFVVPNELPVIAYRELPYGGYHPPDPPCGARLPSVQAVCKILGGGCCS